MRNVPITGGRDVGPPPGWNPALSGECLTISVLQTVEDGAPYQTTAWQFHPDELAALSAGGHLFGSVNSQEVPVQRVWVQSAAGVLVGDMMADRGPGTVQNAAGQRAALIAICDAFCRKRGLWLKEWGALTTSELVAELARMVDRLPAYNAASVVMDLEVFRLVDVPGMGSAHQLTQADLDSIARPDDAPDQPPGKVLDLTAHLVPPGGRRIRGTIEPGSDKHQPIIRPAEQDRPFVRADQCGIPDGETAEVQDPIDGKVTTMVVGSTRWRNWLSDLGPAMAVRRLPPLPPSKDD